jgi:hypothetical protein
LILVGCTSARPTATPAPPASPRIEVLDEPFLLTFQLPKSTWQAGEAIDGTASLKLATGDVSDLGGSGSGLLGFEFREVGGSRLVSPIWTADCRPYKLERGQPLTSPLKRSGGYANEDPNADFIRAFLADTVTRLPAGRWKITAFASFVEGAGCTGASREIRATIPVVITP